MEWCNRGCQKTNPRPSAAFSTPTATVTARQIERDVALLRWSVRVIGEAAPARGFLYADGNGHRQTTRERRGAVALECATRSGDGGGAGASGAGGTADCGGGRSAEAAGVGGGARCL
ncbi:hypothetical protein [Ktedonobacter robiniae]|uniref:hypothetical protein n=1 Tax=Ktedonobacter robiniae TaxID=2778365 RepID=UPI001914FA25|nr:hypothetical protein [Ktedonobacter robiniae]